MTIDLHVALNGDDTNPGTTEAPLLTLHAARDAARDSNESATIVVHDGTYYLEQSLALGALDSGVSYTAADGERVTLSGGRKLDCRWKPFRDGIMKCELPEVQKGSLDFTQLFINGKRQTLARYPNVDNSDPENYTGYVQAAGTIPDDAVDPCPDENADMTFSGNAPRGIAIGSATLAKKNWAKPEEAVIHIYQANYWGNLQWRVRNIDLNAGHIWFGEGGQQMGAKWFKNPSIVNQWSRFFIENVFEELDVPGEWYLDRENGVLYVIPEDGTDLENALIEVPVLEHIVELQGSQTKPVRSVSFKGFRFAHTASTFLNEYEVPSLSDWAIHRGGTILLDGTRDCSIENCWLDAPGGNAIFMNNHNRGNRVTGCTFTECGESAVCLVGALERTTGTQRAFSYECSIENNRITRCGVFGKQVAGVYTSRAKRITVGHNLIYKMPRAGICIGAPGVGMWWSSTTSTTPVWRPATTARSIPGAGTGSGA